MNIRNLIGYYKDCYQADTRTLSISNFFSQKIESRLFLSGKDQLLNEELPYFPVSKEYADAIQSNLALYKREKEFYCAAFFIVGQRDDMLKKQSKVFAPLFLYPAMFVHENDFTYVKINFEKRIININFLNSIKREGVDDLYESIRTEVNSSMADFGNLGILKETLDSRIEDFQADDILFYPNLHNEKKLKHSLSASKLIKQNGYKLLPGVGFGVLRRSSSTQGIISELNLMVKSSRFSVPILNLLSEKGGASAPILKNGIVPAILSEAQQDIISSVNKHRETLVIGPPGTGKSFTISALAIDYLSKGKSVLIASKTDQAVDVIHKKIENDLQIRGVAFRAGRSDYKKILKNQLKDLLTNTRRRPKSKRVDLKDLKSSLELIVNELEEIQIKFETQVNNELEWGSYLAYKWDNPTFFNKLKIKYIKWRNDLTVPLWSLGRRYLSLQESYISVSRQYLLLSFQTHIYNELYLNRPMFRDFLKSLSARTSSRQDLLFENIRLSHLLKTFPIWLVNMADIYDIFPMESNLFDLAIIDEATQCDIASCLPIIQRAKRVVIVGDPKQLRHSSFLSQSIQKSLQEKNGIRSDNVELSLDFRNTSILDFMNDRINSQNQVCFLDEHYRSKPDLIAFSNENFYSSSLRIMTSIPYKDKVKNQFLIDCEGERNSQGYNVKEANSIITEIKKITDFQKNLDKVLCQSIGILSPFRDQVDYIGNCVSKEFGIDEINKHDILCGTAYSFQGEERDIMLISFAIDEKSHHSATIHLNKPDVFNVSITRVRSKQLIFKSFSDGFDAGKYVSSFIQKIKGYEISDTQLKNDYKDEMLLEVKSMLEEDGFECWPEYCVVGMEIDLIFKRGDNFFGVDLIGYPGNFQDALTIEDHKILARASVAAFPLPFTYWKFDQKACYEELMIFSSK